MAKRGYDRPYYWANRDRARKARKKWIAKAKALLSHYRRKPCTDCRRKYPECVMQFDHVRGGKVNKRTVGAMAGNVGLPRLQEEIDKCEIVCANCHAIRTHKRGENRRGGYRGTRT